MHFYRCVSTSGPHLSSSVLHICNQVILFLLKELLWVWTRNLRQHTESRFNPWVVLSRTVQPENGDFRLNLRFVSPWKANSLLQIIRKNTPKKDPKPGWTVLEYVWYLESRVLNYLLIRTIVHQLCNLWIFHLIAKIWLTLTVKYIHFWFLSKILHQVEYYTSVLHSKNKCFGSTTKINATVCINLFELWQLVFKLYWVRGISFLHEYQLIIGSLNW